MNLGTFGDLDNTISFASFDFDRFRGFRSVRVVNGHFLYLTSTHVIRNMSANCTRRMEDECGLHQTTAYSRFQ